MHRFIRKIISVFVAGSANALFFTIAMLDGEKGGFFSMFGIVSFIAFPVVLIYGSLVSLVLEYVTDKWVPYRPIRFTLSGLGHVGFGVLFGVALGLGQPDEWWIWTFAVTALLYFAVDLLLRIAEDKPWRRYARSLMLALPVVGIAGVAWLYH